VLSSLLRSFAAAAARPADVEAVCDGGAGGADLTESPLVRSLEATDSVGFWEDALPLPGEGPAL
jgi:hypothetical protein